MDGIGCVFSLFFFFFSCLSFKKINIYFSSFCSVCGRFTLREGFCGVCLVLISVCVCVCGMYALCHDGDGAGTETWPDGTKYVGDWKNDMKHGQGMSSACGDDL